MLKKQTKNGKNIGQKKYKKGKKRKRWKTLRSEPLWIARGGITPIIIRSWSLPSKIHTLERIFCKYNKISKLIFENGYFSRRHHLILFCFKSVKSLRSLLYFMLSGVERIGYHLDFTETAELCYQMLKPVGAAPGKQVQVLKGLWEKCSSAQIEKLPRRLSQGSLSSNFRTSLSYFEQANVSRNMLWGMQGKLRSKCFMAVLALGVRRRCIYVALAGKPGCQVGPGPGWPRDTTNLPQQPSWIPFLLTLFLFPPHSIFLFPAHLISLSSSY